MSKRKISLRNKLLLVFLCIMLVSVVGVVFISIRSMVTPLREIAIENMKSIVDEFYVFAEANPDMEWAVIRKICNEQITLGETGFIFVIDPEGNLLIHKKAEGENWGNKPHIRDILERKDGTLRYLSPKTNTYKLAAFRYLEEWNWIIVAGAFEEDFLAKPRSEIIKYSTVAGSIICILAAVFIFIYAIKITGPIRRIIAGLTESGEQVGSASEQVASTSQSLAEGSSEQASSLEETSSSLEEMTSMIRQNADNAKQANILATDASASADKGMTAMNSMSDAMGEIKQSSNETAKVIRVIDEIAFQTNLLALNAAVEAARAGEAGKGFAVVAEEVRNLARRSAEAAKETSSLIEGSQKNADNGVKSVEELVEILKEISGGVQKVADLLAEVTVASDEQAQGIDQLNKAVGQMDQVTQQNASNAEESSSASEELASQAQDLQRAVDELSLVIDGSNAKTRTKQSHIPDTQYAKAETHASMQHNLTNKFRKNTPMKRVKQKEKQSAEEVIPLDKKEMTEF